MNTHRIAHWFGAALLLGLLAGSATAQFPGNIYLQTPANVVAAGGEVVVRVMTFTGTRRFGAAQFTVTFDPTVLQFLGASLPTTSPLQVSVGSKGGRLALVVTNARGDDDPFGIVPLADLRFRAIGAPASASPLDLTAVAQIALDATPVPTVASDGSVLVTSAAASALASSLGGAPTALAAPLVFEPLVPLQPTAVEQQVAVWFGRPGELVALWRPVLLDGRVAAAKVEVPVPAVLPPECCAPALPSPLGPTPVDASRHGK
jgi:hypothetical protein